MHFGITEKPTMDCISPYNNAGLISKVFEKIATKSLKIAVVDNPTVVWRPLHGESPRIFAQFLYHQKPESLFYILPLTVWVYLHSNFCDGLPKTHLFCNRVRIGRSSHPSSLILAPIANNNNIIVSSVLHRFWDRATYWLKIANFSYPTII